MSDERREWMELVADLREEVERLQGDNRQLRQTLNMVYLAQQAASSPPGVLHSRTAESEFRIDVDNPLFEGLVGGAIDVPTLLATIRHVKQQRDQTTRLLFAKMGPIRYGELRKMFEEYPWLREMA